MKPKRKHPEYDLQVQVAAYLRAVLDPRATFSAIGHGGGGAVRGARLKAAGLLPGVPDFMVFWPGPPSRLIWLELKSKRGSLSDDQMSFYDRATKAGHGFAVIKSIKDVEEMLKLCNAPTRGRVMA